MGIERRGSGSYYYEKQRINGRVVSRYWGSGTLANALGSLAELERRRRDLDRDLAQAARREADDLASAGADFSRAVQVALRAALIVGGYREHRREWRKQRGSADGRATAVTLQKG